jgi:hypothetical protein
MYTYLQHVWFPAARAAPDVVSTPAKPRAVAPAHRPSEPRNPRRDTRVASSSASLLVVSNMIDLRQENRRMGLHPLRWVGLRSNEMAIVPGAQAEHRGVAGLVRASLGG